MNLNRFTAPRLVRAPQDEGGGSGEGEGASAAPDLSFIGDTYKTDAGYDLDRFRADYEQLASRDAMYAERMAEVPEDPTGYEFAIPEDVDFGDLDLPEGFAVDLKADDPQLAPLFEGLGGFMHKHGIPKSATPELMGLLAKYEAAKYSGLYAAAQAEMQSLGTAAQARISNVKRSLEAKLPADLAQALTKATSTAAGVKALERLLAPARSTTTQTSVPPGADVDNMTPAQMLRYANRQRMGAA
jgi:hypothetical protein